MAQPPKIRTKAPIAISKIVRVDMDALLDCKVTGLKESHWAVYVKEVGKYFFGIALQVLISK